MESTPDAVVVGAGAAGLWCAWFLRQAGCDVTVVERTAVGDPSACSSGNTGFMAHGGAPLTDARSLHGGLATRTTRGARPWLRHLTAVRDAAPAGRAILAALKQRSIAILAQVSATANLGGTASFPGLIIAFRTPQALAAAAANAAASAPTQVLDGDQLRALEPDADFTVAGALHQSEGAVVELPGFLTAFGQALRASGVRFREHVRVTDFVRRGSRVTAVRTTAGELAAGHVVLAAGVRTGSFARKLGERLAIAPLKGYSITLPAPAGTPHRPVLLAEETIALRPYAGRLRLAGGLTLSSAPGVSAGDVDRLVTAVAGYLPSLALAGAREVWTGHRPATPDSLPYLGRTARYANVSVACGYGHVGMGLAPVAGKLVAQQLLGVPPELDMHPFRNDRFAGVGP